MKKTVIVLLLILTTTLSCTTKYRNMHSFETVWQTVNQVHYDPTFGGVDWKAAHAQYKPQIAAVENKEESFLVINQMLFKLNLSHLLAVYPTDLMRYMPVLFAEGDIGADVRLLDGQAVITRVRKKTPAARAGLRPGFVIERIDGKPVEQIIQEGEAMRIPGYLLIANWKKLLNGASFMYAFAQPIMPDGKIIEGNGVDPDIEVELNRDELLKGKDSQLDAAINYIMTKTQ